MLAAFFQRRQLVGVFVRELTEIDAQARRRHAARDGGGNRQPRHLGGGFEMALGGRPPSRASAFLADAGDHVGERRRSGLRGSTSLTAMTPVPRPGRRAGQPARLVAR
jgi:hypothetical protein